MLRRVARPAVLLPVLAVTVLAAATARPGAADALARYRAGAFAAARTALDEAGDEGDADAALLLRASLARRPDPALTALEGAITSLPARSPLAQAARLDAAGLRFAQGRHQDVLAVLDPLVAGDGKDAPGRALLMAGLSRRALGDTEGAAALLATVKPDDPSFAAARTALGDLALADREPAKALRYYETAALDARAGAGRWQALRLDGRLDDADRLRKDLERRDPGCVALLEINRVLRAEADDAAARRASAPARRDSTTAASAGAGEAGGYTLQLGAFSDRGLALDLMRRFRDQIADLRIDVRQDDRGQYIYKVRTGAFVNPALARSEAERLKRSLGVDIFVAESAD
ncbi:MAG TPA: SPOR domain-containing protein [Candidatus Krumholzibacteria bacterium]|nr:SPOR domain-containing protein [Candidatus Krumholzibacteria bacterium]